MGIRKCFLGSPLRTDEGFDRWRELQPHRQRDGMYNMGFMMVGKVAGSGRNTALVSREET